MAGSACTTTPSLTTATPPGGSVSPPSRRCPLERVRLLDADAEEVAELRRVPAESNVEVLVDQAAVLAVGDGAVLSHDSAAELWRLTDKPLDPIHVSVPFGRRVSAPSGVRLHRRRTMPRAQPARLPPRTTVEETVVDLTQTARCLDDAIGWLARACAGRLTTPARLAQALAGRRRLRWHAALRAALDDVALGCHSLLEMRYLRRVERAHNLPVGHRQRRRQSTYSDVEYEKYGLNVELDGRVPHEGDGRLRDRRRTIAESPKAFAGCDTATPRSPSTTVQPPARSVRHWRLGVGPGG